MHKSAWHKFHLAKQQETQTNSSSTSDLSDLFFRSSTNTDNIMSALDVFMWFQAVTDEHMRHCCLYIHVDDLQIKSCRVQHHFWRLKQSSFSSFAVYQLPEDCDVNESGVSGVHRRWSEITHRWSRFSQVWCLESESMIDDSSHLSAGRPTCFFLPKSFFLWGKHVWFHSILKTKVKFCSYEHKVLFSPDCLRWSVSSPLSSPLWSFGRFLELLLV